jgi:hypothetical protein
MLLNYRIAQFTVMPIAALSIFVATAHAEVKTLICAMPGGSGSDLVTLDYGAQTLGVDWVDEAGNVTIMAYHSMPANITDETVSATFSLAAGDYTRFTLNRYSGVLRTESDHGAGYRDTYSKACVPYERGPQKF